MNAAFRRLAVGVILALFAGSGCGFLGGTSGSGAGQSVSELPDEYKYIVSAGPSIASGPATSEYYFVDADGSLITKQQAGKVGNPAPSVGSDQALLPTRDGAVLLEPGTRRLIDSAQSLVHSSSVGSTGDKEQLATVYNSGDTSENYGSQYLFHANGESFTGKVEGLVQASGICKGELYILTKNLGDLDGIGDYTFNVWNIDDRGNKTRVGEFQIPELQRIVFSSIPCSSDGTSLEFPISVFDTEPSDYVKVGRATVNLLDGTINTALDSESSVFWRNRSRGAVRVGPSIFWLTSSGAVQSLPSEGAPSVKERWRIPFTDPYIATLSGSEIVTLRLESKMYYIQSFRTETGEPVGAEIALPWLNGELDLNGLIGNGTEFPLSSVNVRPS